ncbi:hypothetical protein IAT38_001829 [Cryptococcus sp. DSM 104549]
MSLKITPASRPFRILALPLARIPKPPAVPSAAPSPAPSSALAAPGATDGATSKTPLLIFHVSQPAPDGSVKASPLNRVLAKASDTWLKLGDKPKDSWMYWFYAKGEKLMDNIEFEEWALKAVKEGEGVRISKEGEILDRIEIPLLSPDLAGQPMPPLLPKLHRMLIHRIPHHRKMMYRTILVSPITWPFAIIPIIPNFPLFYVLWRAWSHYKAWRGATYLEKLLKAGLIVERKSPELTAIYAGEGRSRDAFAESKAAHGGINAQAEKRGALDGTATPSSMVFGAGKPAPAGGEAEHGTVGQPLPVPAPGPVSSKAAHPSLLLLPSQIPLLARKFELGAYEVVDVTRAVEQADYRARKADKEREEKAKAEAEAKGKQWTYPGRGGGEV